MVVLTILDPFHDHPVVESGCVPCVFDVDPNSVSVSPIVGTHFAVSPIAGTHFALRSSDPVVCVCFLRGLQG